MRFIEKEDCYLDQETGLEWAKEDIISKDWYTAMTSIPNGWRPPTIKELLTLVDYEKYSPATDLPNIKSSNYWSSTTYVDSPHNAWSVYFYNGYGDWDNKSYNYYVRAVRGTTSLGYWVICKDDEYCNEEFGKDQLNEARAYFDELKSKHSVELLAILDEEN